MYDQATIDRNVRRIKKVNKSQATMIPDETTGEFNASDKKATEAWRKQALAFWKTQQEVLNNYGKEE